MIAAGLRAPLLVAVALGALLAALRGGPDAAGAAEPSGQPLPAVSALLTTETVEIDAEGVTRTTRFQERLWRDPSHVWIERVFPAGVAPKKAEDAHGINLRVASRLYTRGEGDAVKAQLVSLPDATVVDLQPSEYAGLGVSPRWSVAAELVDRAKLVPGAAQGGGVWLARRGGPGKDVFRVLWSSRLELPLVIESGTVDGRARTRITVEPTPLAPAADLPWTKLGKLEHRELSDLED